MSAKTGMLVAYRTVQYPQMANCNESAKAMDHQIGYRYQVTYLNAAGREVSVNSALPMHIHQSLVLGVYHRHHEGACMQIVYCHTSTLHDEQLRKRW